MSLKVYQEVHSWASWDGYGRVYGMVIGQTYNDGWWRGDGYSI